jgi:hypothetical protein
MAFVPCIRDLVVAIGTPVLVHGVNIILSLCTRVMIADLGPRDLLRPVFHIIARSKRTHQARKAT